VADADQSGTRLNAQTPADAADLDASVDPAGALEPGDPDRIGSYELLGRLGHGGMGTVYLARSAEGKRVAVKVIRPELAADAAFVARFHREVAAARQVAGFCTARVLDAGLETPSPYLVTEYVEGVRLDRAIARHGPLTGSNLDGFAVGVAAALTAIHAANVVHRDLKPSNVLLSYFGPRVIDFGIARALDASAEVTRASVVMGTPGWMAPEQLVGEPATHASDIFAWGTLLAYAATGRQPYGEGSPTQVAYRIIHGQPDLDGFDGPLRATVERVACKDPATRPNAKALLMELLGEQQVADVEPRVDPKRAVTQVLQRTWVTPGADHAPPPPRAAAAPTRPLGQASIVGDEPSPTPPEGPAPAPGPAARADAPPDAPPEAPSRAAAADGDAGRPWSPPGGQPQAWSPPRGQPQQWPADPWGAPPQVPQQRPGAQAPQRPAPQPQASAGGQPAGWPAGWHQQPAPYPPAQQWPQPASPWRGQPPAAPHQPGAPAGAPKASSPGSRPRVWTARLMALVAVLGAIGSGADYYSNNGGMRLLAVRLLAMFTLLTIGFFTLPASPRARVRAVTSRLIGGTIIVLTAAAVFGLTERRTLRELVGSLASGLVVLFIAFWLYPKRDT